jgi:poly(hydroxyalkanoate) depolymerase family esterase
LSPRRANWIGAWFALARTARRASAKLGKSAGRAAAKEAGKRLPQARKTAQWLLSGVATPAPEPAAGGSGRWLEGWWGLGPLAMRRYRLYLPPAATARRPLPLLMLLHGCGQDAASFAATTRAAAGARAGGFAVLLPEQSSEANPQRCWNWFGPEPVVALETGILMAMVDHLSTVHPLRSDRVFALGLSAGGAMAMSLALRYPERFVAVGTHSAAVPHSAATPLQAGRAMRGRRGPKLAALRKRLAGRALPRSS